MAIPGIPDDHLERLHLYLGPGKGSTYAYKHVPSGIMVGGAKPPQMKSHEYDQQLIAELTEKLKAAGIITATETEKEKVSKKKRCPEPIRPFSSRTNGIMAKHRIYTTSVASVYPHYLAKAEKKGRTKAEVDEIIRWLTGYTQRELEGQLKNKTDFETFFAKAPSLNPSRALVKGVICGVRIEDIEEPTMREIRYLDKLIDELAKGKPMDKILRKPAEDDGEVPN